MPNTYFLKDYISRIDALNDQLWYYLFTTEELNGKLSQFSSDEKQKYVEDMFSTNPYRRRIHIKLESIPAQQAENLNLTFGAYFTTCYEISSKYIAQVFEVLKVFNSLTAYSWNSQKEPEKNLVSLLTASGMAVPNSNFTDTFSYLRLRRNHYTHINETISPKLLGFITTNAARLNAFWNSSPRRLRVNFTSTVVGDFTQNETVDLIKAIRICLIEIDAHIAPLLNVNSIIEYFTKAEYANNPSRINSEIIEQRVNKIKHICKQEMKINITSTQIIPYVSTIGIR